MAKYKNYEKKEAPISIYLDRLFPEENSNGKWVPLPQEENELRKIHDRIKRTDGSEIYIMDLSVRKDCEYAKEVIWEWSNVFELNTVATLIGDEPHPAVEAYMQGNDPTLLEFANLFMQEEKIPFYFYKIEGSDNPEVMEDLTEEEKMGYTIIERNQELKNMLESLPLGNSNVMGYLDVKAVGRDMLLSGDVVLTDQGYYDKKSDALDLFRYSFDMIREELVAKDQEAAPKQPGERLAAYEKQHPGRKADTKQKKETTKKRQHKSPAAPSF